MKNARCECRVFLSLTLDLEISSAVYWFNKRLDGVKWRIKFPFFFHGENEILVTEIGNHKQKMAT